MCAPAVCPTCRKRTWQGCSLHAEQVMKGVAPQDRCVCHEAANADLRSDESAIVTLRW